MMNKKVYALIITYPHEFSEVLGVYSSEDIANTEKSKAEGLDDSNGYNDFAIEEFKIDG